MKNLLCMGQMAALSFNSKLPLPVVKGGKFDESYEIMKRLEPFSNQLLPVSNVGMYLMDNPSEIEKLERFFDTEDTLKTMNTVLSTDEGMQELLSIYSSKDWEKTSVLANGYSTYLMLKLVKFANDNNIQFLPGYSIRHIIESTIVNSMDKVNTILQCNEVALRRLFYTKNFSLCSGENLAKSIEELSNDEFFNLYNFIANWCNDIETEYLLDKNYAQMKRTLGRLYVLKLIPMFGKEKAKRKMQLVCDLFFLDKCDQKRLYGFYNNVQKSFFEKNDTITIADYLNVAYGSKNTRLLERCPHMFNEIVLFALKERKTRFLEVLENNLDALNNKIKESGCGNPFYRCILLNEYVYKNILNLNEVNDSDLFKLLELPYSNYGIKQKLTPKELIAVYNGDNDAYRLYELMNTKIDKKLLVLRQLQSIECEFSQYDNEVLQRIANKLCESNISQRIDKFPFTVSGETIIKILALDERFDTYISEANSEIELEFIARNQETIEFNLSLAENLDLYLEKDMDTKDMLEKMNLTEEFMTSYKKEIQNFCLMGNASIVMTFYRNIQTINRWDEEMKAHQKEAILTIAKAAMSNQMERFKFHDLAKEIERELTPVEKSTWVENFHKEYKQFAAYETYSFNDTMLLGVKPTTTCMNYASGQYRYCLLANFDSNKKIIFVRKNGIIVARALVRLTKSLSADEILSSNKVSFLDVESNDVEEKFVTAEGREKITLFLERFYSGHINNEETKLVKRLIVEMLMEKAKNMDARLLLASCYAELDGVKEKNMKVFISHTKNGYQYMDSFGGSNSESAEATYKVATCYGFDMK